MFSFIRDEWLSMIIARKQYVKDSKTKKKKIEVKKSNRPGSALKEEAKVRARPNKADKTPGELGESMLR